MIGRRIPWTALLTLLAALVTVGGIAVGAEATIDELAGAQVTPSAYPDLLGPIDEKGRLGWDCAPERAANARKARAAELPADRP